MKNLRNMIMPQIILEAEIDQINFKSSLGEMKKGNNKRKIKGAKKCTIQ